jgi:hypothetical protein
MYWGACTWNFLHTLVHKVKEEYYDIIGQQLLSRIIEICYHLPCPECCKHAKMFWKHVRVENVKTKTDLINLIFMFHNAVNKRKQKTLFKQNELIYYESQNLIETYNTFYKNFNTTGNMNFINDEFHRKLMLVNLKKWLKFNLAYFDLK